jgi:hypothetical protein
MTISNKKCIEAREHKLFLKDPPHLGKNKALDLADVLESLLPVLLAANLALNSDFLQKAETLLFEVRTGTGVLLAVVVTRGAN